MRLGIEASNLRAGGGITHLAELLRSAEPADHGFSHVIVWGGQTTLRALPERSWLVKSSPHGLDGSQLARALWQRRGVAAAARAAPLRLVRGGAATAAAASYAGRLLPPCGWPDFPDALRPGHHHFRREAASRDDDHYSARRGHALHARTP